jgi:RHS repeat-associated protein
MDERYGITASNAFVNAVAGRGVWRDTLNRVRSERGATDSLRVRRYAYDRLSRLIADSAGSYPNCSADSIAGETCLITSVDSVHAYGFDALGNRTDQSGSYDTLDRIQSFAGYSFEHDADGNVTRRNGSGQDVRFFWSAEGRLDSVNVVSGTRTWYQYDAAGRLARRSVNGSLDRLFVWQGDQLLAEVRYVSQNTVALVAEYSWYPGIDQPHAVRTAGGLVRYFGSDGLGSVSVLTEGSKPLVYFNYEPWGRALVRVMSGAEIPTDTVRPRWKGAFFEPVAGGLYYMRNRWYDPATGRFASEDPVGLDAGPNLYVFAVSDPVNARDPYGLDMTGPECDDPNTPAIRLCPINTTAPAAPLPPWMLMLRGDAATA